MGKTFQTRPENRDNRSPSIDWDSHLRGHGGWLRSVIAARLGEPQMVDEVMQEVALAAIASPNPPTDLAKLAPWLYRLAVRQSMLYRRQKGRQRRLLDNYGSHIRSREDDSTGDPLRWLMADERLALIRQALGQMHQRDREILLLKYAQDWSYRQISEHLGISHSAVEARLHRARQRLRAALSAWELAPSQVK